MTKPSERILPEMNRILIDAILQYLDEESEKPKYACPNCHRIVDELFSDTNTLMTGELPPNRCKHCVDKKNKE
jgi:hypothetical protein